MRNLALVAVFAFVMPLAGCLSDGSGSNETGDGGAQTNPVIPPVPVGAAAEFLPIYEAFVTTYDDRADNKPTHLGARDELERLLASYNLTVWRHNFTAGGMEQQNIVGIQWGHTRDEWVIVGGHYDTFHIDCIASSTCAGREVTQGAYDDGSGTMLSVYMAKMFANITPEYTIAYALFDGEERGLEGSRALAGFLAEEATPWGDITMRAAINADMFGLTWPGVQTPVEFIHTSAAMEASVEAARKIRGVPDNMIKYGDAAASEGSDFESFVNEEVPTGFFSSNMGSEGVPASGSVPADVPSAPGYYPFWHIVDTWETMTAMAGSPMHLEQGFQTAIDLMAALLWSCAVDPTFEP